MAGYTHCVSGYTCADIEKSLLELDKDEVFERKILFSWNNKALKTNIYPSWHISYTSPNIYALLRGQIGIKAGKFSGKYPIVTSEDVYFSDSLHTQVWQESIDTVGGFTSWDYLADMAASSIRDGYGDIIEGIIDDDINDSELKTMRVERLRVVYAGTDLAKYIGDEQRFKINERFRVNEIAKKYGLSFESNGDRKYLMFDTNSPFEEKIIGMKNAILKLKYHIKV